MATWAQNTHDISTDKFFPGFPVDDMIFGTAEGSNIASADGYDWIDCVDTYLNMSAATGRLLETTSDAFRVAPPKALIANFEERLFNETREYKQRPKDHIVEFLSDLRHTLAAHLGVDEINKDADVGLLLNAFATLSKEPAQAAREPSILENLKGLVLRKKSEARLPSLDDSYSALSRTAALIADEAEAGRLTISTERLELIADNLDSVVSAIGKDIDYDYEASQLKAASARLTEVASEMKASGPKI